MELSTLLSTGLASLPVLLQVPRLEAMNSESELHIMLSRTLDTGSIQMSVAGEGGVEVPS